MPAACDLSACVLSGRAIARAVLWTRWKAEYEPDTHIERLPDVAPADGFSERIACAGDGGFTGAARRAYAAG